MGLNPTKTATFFEELRVFSTSFSPPSETALRLRSLPEGGPPLGEIFSNLLVKINDFLMEIVIILIRVVFFD